MRRARVSSACYHRDLAVYTEGATAWYKGQVRLWTLPPLRPARAPTTGWTCDACFCYVPEPGPVWTCSTCPDFDLCDACMASSRDTTTASPDQSTATSGSVRWHFAGEHALVRGGEAAEYQGGCLRCLAPDPSEVVWRCFVCDDVTFCANCPPAERGRHYHGQHGFYRIARSQLPGLPRSATWAPAVWVRRRRAKSVPPPRRSPSIEAAIRHWDFLYR